MDDVRTPEIGVMVNNLEPDRLRAFAVAAGCGFRLVHTNALREAWLTGPERAAYVAAARASGLTIAAMFVGFDGQSYADFDSIRRTVGFLNPALRAHRLEIAFRYVDLAGELGVPALAMHVGFVPEEPADSNYVGMVECVRALADRAAAAGQVLNLETGQEPAEALRSFVQTVGRANVGVNFDVGNFVLYGTDEPLHALDVLGPLIGGVHCKDGRRATAAGALGTETPLGQGDVPFPAFLRRLRAGGYRGPLVIEREHGPSVRADVERAREYLHRLLAEIPSESTPSHG